MRTDYQQLDRWKQKPDTNRNIAFAGVAIMAASFIFALIETGYFGWNISPKSTAERLCDMLAGVLSSIGCALYLLAIIKSVKQRIDSL